MIIQRGPRVPKLTVEFGPVPTDAEAARVVARRERSRRNSEWFQAHRSELLPLATGKHLAVAGEEAFIADSPEEAWAWADRTHPEDDTATVQYVSPERGPKIYAYRG
jgi:hypothetical protein